MQKAALLIAQGAKLCEVAKECGVTPQTLSDWRSNPFFVVLSNQIQQNILNATEAKLINLSLKAVSNLEEMLDSENDRIRFEATKEVLKISGFESPINVGATTFAQHLKRKSYELDSVPLTELQQEVEEAIQEASIVDI